MAWSKSAQNDLNGCDKTLVRWVEMIRATEAVRGRRRLTIVGCALTVILGAAAAGGARAETDDDGWEEDDASATGLAIHGFVESAAATRVTDAEAHPDDLVLGEARFRLEVSHESDLASASFKGDINADAVLETVKIDVREAVVAFNLGQRVEAKLGRQVLTWGTGDFVFLNDLFPKDFVAFFSGRSDEYLKAPAYAAKVSLFLGALNVDLVWMPLFSPDRFIDGRRLTAFSPIDGRIVGGAAAIDPVMPRRTLRRGELATRLYRRIAGYELALYGYLGFIKQPLAVDRTTGRPTFSRLAVYGASARGALFGGVANLEGAFHHAFEDNDGRDPTQPNSQLRGLAGYALELVAHLNLGLQYYFEYTLWHKRLLAASPNPQFEFPRWRHQPTLRLTYLLLQDQLSLSLFAFVGVDSTSVDCHLRPAVSYKLSDALMLTLGANVMFGSENHTFFGQLEQNSNVYLRARYAF